MALNDPERPHLARAAQDVDAAPQLEPQGPQHYGRGGAANVVGQDEQRAAQRKSAEEANRQETGAGKGLLSKGKEFLDKQLGKK